MPDDTDDHEKRLTEKALRALLFAVIAAGLFVLVVATAWDGEVRSGKKRGGVMTLSREKSPELYWTYVVGLGGCSIATSAILFVLAYRMHKRTFDPDDPKWQKPHWYRKLMEKRSAGDVSEKSRGGKT